MASRVKVAGAAPVAPSRVRTTPPKLAEGGPPKPGLSYFADSTQRDLEFVSTGCTLLDQVLGGGYVLGRMSNVIGDKSTGKTLLAIEGMANFAMTYKSGLIRLAEAESAFDRGYAGALGLPLDRVEWAKLENAKGEADRTVEWLFDDITDTINRLKGDPAFYVLDSLDALSDRAEMARDISDGTFGAAKAKKLGELFRRLVGDIEKSRLCLIIISQIRDKIGVTFGETKMRAGGHAMDFYATHCLWLHQIKTLTQTVAKIERPIGLQIKAKCKKNKVGLPLRECEFPLRFGYGVDDLQAGLDFIHAAGAHEAFAEMGLTAAGYKISVNALRNRGGAEVAEFRALLAMIVAREWSRIEQSFLPRASKY